MFCKNCGNTLNEGASFCPKCGFATNSENPKPVENIPTQLNTVDKKKNKIKPLYVLIPVALLIIAAILWPIFAPVIVSSSVEKKLEGYWVTSYQTDNYKFYNVIEIRKSGDEYEGLSSIMVKDENGETVHSEDSSYSGKLVVDKSSSTVRIENNKMGAAMVFRYTENGGTITLTLDKYWCNGGDPFINNLADSYLPGYIKTKD